MKYTNHLNYRKRRRFIIKLRIVVAFFVVLILASSAFFYLKYLRIDDVNTDAGTTSEKTASIVNPSIRIFKTPYFQIQTSKDWVEVPHSSNSNKFAYSSIRNGLIEHELVVYVDQVPANLTATRVMPVSFTDLNTRLIPAEVSDNCIKQVPVNNPSIFFEAKLLDIKFKCDVTNSVYSVMAGTPQSGTLLDLYRPNGLSSKYTIVYKNLKAENDAIEFKNILSTFQTR